MKKSTLFILLIIVFKTSIIAQTWVKVSNAAMGNSIKGLIVKSNILHSTTGFSGVASTTDGLSWTTSTTGLTGTGPQTKRLGADNSYIYVGTPNGVYRSNDFGVSWENTDLVLGSNANNYGNYFGFFGGTTFCVMSATQVNGGGLFRTINNGTTWLQNQSGIPTNEPLTNIIEIGSNLFIGSSLSIYKSSDNGVNWSALSVPSTAQHSGLYNHNGRLLVMNNHPTTGGIIYSDDSGASWQTSTGVPTGFTAGKIISGGGALYCMAPGKGVYSSIDNGLTWSDFTGDLPSLDISLMADIEFFNGNIYVATFTGVMSTNAITTSISTIKINDSIFSYPNPFNELVFVENTKKLSLKISVQDIQGKVLLSKVESKEKISINTESLIMGVYILSIVNNQTGEIISNQKIVK